MSALRWVAEAQRSEERAPEPVAGASSLKRSYTAMAAGDVAVDGCALSAILSSLSLSSTCSRLVDVRPEERSRVEEHLVRLLLRCRPNAPMHLQQRLPSLAHKLENILYQYAATKADYIDSATLHRRLAAIGDACKSKKRKVVMI
ncbi:hypothetical protein ACHHYP_02579 [Achlya hypogyna]|uniref:Uncharacterized protein n=1 Tax=Achlya hypogyna TaxID=1202772 RepID=A0A1V9Z5X3_ACHHY|nr:hypothetical protein ACHHYP_02579 [Achlya hypogyna]